MHHVLNVNLRIPKYSFMRLINLDVATPVIRSIDDAAAPVEPVGSVTAIGGFSLSVLLIARPRSALGPQWRRQRAWYFFCRPVYLHRRAPSVWDQQMNTPVCIYNDVRAPAIFLFNKLSPGKARQVY